MHLRRQVLHQVCKLTVDQCVGRNRYEAFSGQEFTIGGSCLPLSVVFSWHTYKDLIHDYFPLVIML